MKFFCKSTIKFAKFAQSLKVILMKKVLFFLLLLSCCAVRAQTIEVSGPQTGIWDADTVLVTGDVIVLDSVIVLPGTVVLMDGFHSIEVTQGASFRAQGLSTDSIVFTVVDTTGFSGYFDSNGAWKGFMLEKASRVRFDYCLFEYGKSIDSLNLWGGAVNIHYCEDVQFHHSVFHHNVAFKRGGAISARGSRVEMNACSLHHNTVIDTMDLLRYGGAADFLKCDVELREMEFRDNDGSLCIGGALSLDSCSVILERSVFVRNKGVNGGGLYLMRSNDYECRLSNLLFDDNYSVHFGGGFALSDVSAEVSNVLVINNESYGVSCSGIFFYGDCSPVMRNCIVYGNYPSPDNPQLDTTQLWTWTMNGNAPLFYNCLIEGGLEHIHSYEFIKVWEDMIDTDPMFVDADNHDFHLASGSPCIDAGDPNTPQYVLDGLDLDGNPRVVGQRIDIGPFEYAVAAVHKNTTASFAKLDGNPLGAQSRIVFDDAVEGEATLSVYDMTGRCGLCESFDMKGNKNLAIGELVERLASGVYLIEVKCKTGICTFKAVK